MLSVRLLACWAAECAAAAGDECAARGASGVSGWILEMAADRERQFWITVRQALLLVVAAIESRYQLESAVITNAQRKLLHQTQRASRRDVDIEQQS